MSDTFIPDVAPQVIDVDADAQAPRDPGGRRSIREGADAATILPGENGTPCRCAPNLVPPVPLLGFGTLTCHDRGGDCESERATKARYTLHERWGTGGQGYVAVRMIRNRDRHCA